jgi:hypothetical protein
MKKMIIVAALFAASMGAYAQGTVNFQNYSVGTIQSWVYAPDTVSSSVQTVGATSGDYPTTGTTTYTGAKLTGTGYSAQLWAASGANATSGFAACTNGTSVVTLSFRTGTTAAGRVNGATSVGVPGVSQGGTATFQMRVWDNAAGTITSYDSALTKGASSYFTVANLGGTTVTPPNLVGLTSFNLATVPEPATIALGVIGAAALLLRRRK